MVIFLLLFFEFYMSTLTLCISFGHSDVLSHRRRRRLFSAVIQGRMPVRGGLLHFDAALVTFLVLAIPERFCVSIDVRPLSSPPAHLEDINVRLLEPRPQKRHQVYNHQISIFPRSGKNRRNLQYRRFVYSMMLVATTSR